VVPIRLRETRHEWRETTEAKKLFQLPGMSKERNKHGFTIWLVVLAAYFFLFVFLVDSLGHWLTNNLGY